MSKLVFEVILAPTPPPRPNASLKMADLILFWGSERKDRGRVRRFGLKQYTE